MSHTDAGEAAAAAADNAIAEHVAVDTATAAAEVAVSAQETADVAVAVAETAPEQAVAAVAPAVEQASETATAAGQAVVAVAAETEHGHGEFEQFREETRGALSRLESLIARQSMPAEEPEIVTVGDSGDGQQSETPEAGRQRVREHKRHKFGR